MAVALAGWLFVMAISGCSGGLDPNTTVAQALSILAQNAAQVPALNQITVSDLIAGFQQFAGGMGMAQLPSLTADQVQQIQDLQAQVDQGQITQADFATQVNSIIGATLPAGMMANLDVCGGPFGLQMGTGTAALLNLTDAQRQQELDITQRLHDDIQKLRQDAHDKILAVLTPEQQALLTQISQGRSSPTSQPIGLGMNGQGLGMGMGMGTGMGMGAGTGVMNGTMQGMLFQDIATQLQLTDDQKAQIQQIRADLRTAVQARHQQARDEFLAILTPEQQAILNQQQQPPPSV
jgi:Spy/CpxP family protein refolding chaperone